MIDADSLDPDLPVLAPRNRYDAAIVGLVDGGMGICYSRERVVQILMKEDNLNYGDAHDFVDFNMTGQGVSFLDGIDSDDGTMPLAQKICAFLG